MQPVLAGSGFRSGLVEFKGVVVNGPPLRHPKRGMSPRHEQQVLRAGIVHLPHHLNGAALQTVAHLQLKVEGVSGKCLRRVLKPVPALVHVAEQRLELHVSGKAVGAHGVFLLLVAVLAVVAFSHKGEQNRRVPVPDSRVRVPEKLPPRQLVVDPGQLRSVTVHRYQQFLIFQGKSLSVLFHSQIPHSAFALILYYHFH